MNNTGRINSGIGTRQRSVYGKSERRTAPAWLIMICRLILILTQDDVVEMARTILALGAVAMIVVIAGGMEFGAVPMSYGILICGSLAALALFATRDF